MRPLAEWVVSKGFAMKSSVVVADLAVGAENRSPSRLGWLDQARGIGIVLVVVGHALRGLIAADVLPDNGGWHMLDRTIYAFHMPLFFFLAALVFSTTANAPHFFGRRISRLIWPLFLWTWIFFALHMAAPATNMQSLQDFPWLPLPPRLHFWFLWAMFLLNVVGWFSLRRGWAGPTAAALIVLAMFWATRVDARTIAWFGPALWNFPIFAAGMLVTLAPFRRLAELSAIRRSGITTVAAAVFAFALAFAATPDPKGELVAQLIAFAAVGGLVLMLALMPLPGWLGMSTEALGRNSMAIFLAHTIFSAGVRIALAQAGVTDPVLNLVLGIVAGLVGPLVLAALVWRAGLTRLAGF